MKLINIIKEEINDFDWVEGIKSPIEIAQEIVDRTSVIPSSFGGRMIIVPFTDLQYNEPQMFPFGLFSRYLVNNYGVVSHYQQKDVFLRFVRQFKSKYGKSDSGIISEAKIKVNKDEYLKLFEDKTVLVLKPLTHQASCKYGSGTKWCVTSRVSDKWWKQYTKKTSLFAGTNWYNVVGEVQEELKRSWLDKLMNKPIKIVKKEVKEFIEQFPVGVLYFVIIKQRIVGYEYDNELKYNKPIYKTADPKDPMNKLALLYTPNRADFGDMSLFNKGDHYTYISHKLDASHNNMSIYNSLDQKVTLKEVSKVLDTQFSTPFSFIEEDFQKEMGAIDKILKNVMDKVYPLFGGEGSKHKGQYREPVTWVTDTKDELQAVRTSDIETTKGITWKSVKATKYKLGGM